MLLILVYLIYVVVAYFGLDNLGGAAANRVTAGGSGIVGTTLGGVGGNEISSLAAGNLPAHTHSGNTGTTDMTHSHEIGLADDGSVVAGNMQLNLGAGNTWRFLPGSPNAEGGDYNGGGATSTSDPSHSHTITSITCDQCSGTAFNNMPPTMMTVFAIRAI